MHPTISERPKSHAVCVVDPDLPLVNVSGSGDVSAFEELLKRYDRKLYRIAQCITDSDEDAEDAVQTAFLKAYQNLNHFDGNETFSTWLVRIAINESLVKLRKLPINRKHSLDAHNGFGDHGIQSRLDLTDWAANPKSLYSAREFRQILENSLQKLQPRLRVVFFLCDIEGHSISETSGLLSHTATAVKARLSRARLQLRQELTRYFKKHIEPKPFAPRDRIDRSFA